jgi:hypothetical protein
LFVKVVSGLCFILSNVLLGLHTFKLVQLFIYLNTCTTEKANFLKEIVVYCITFRLTVVFEQGLVIKNYMIILEGKATCHRNKMIPKNQFWKKVSLTKKVTPAFQQEFWSYSFGDFCQLTFCLSWLENYLNILSYTEWHADTVVHC